MVSTGTGVGILEFSILYEYPVESFVHYLNYFLVILCEVLGFDDSL